VKVQNQQPEMRNGKICGFLKQLTLELTHCNKHVKKGKNFTKKVIYYFLLYLDLLVNIKHQIIGGISTKKAPSLQVAERHLPSPGRW
jgi:hypothetical protein